MTSYSLSLRVYYEDTDAGGVVYHARYLAFAERARRQGRRCSSIVGESGAVQHLWSLLTPSWGRARAVREAQPVMALDGTPVVAPDPAVRPVRRDEVETLLPACIAMFTEEIGVSPLAGDGGALYRARVTELVTQGRAYARIEDGQVLFKAEVGAATSSVCQVQGVWVHPSLRGRGLSVGGTAAVAVLARAHVAPVVSLYVNDYNTAARRAYERVGFRQVSTFTAPAPIRCPMARPSISSSPCSSSRNRWTLPAACRDFTVSGRACRM